MIGIRMKTAILLGVCVIGCLGSCTRSDESPNNTTFENITEMTFNHALRKKDGSFSVTDKNVIAEIVKTIKLKPKEPCDCAHKESVIFQKGNTRIQVHFCSHCFVIVEAGKHRQYEMPKEFYDHYKRLADEYCNARMVQKLQTLLAIREGRLQSGETADSFFRTLNELLTAQGLDTEGYADYRNDGTFAGLDRAVACEVFAAGVRYVAVVQTHTSMDIPGISAQQILLFSREGKILDKIQCDINSRYGVIATQVLDQPESDGALLIVRFTGRIMPGEEQTWWHNWHRIVYKGISKTFTDTETHRNIWDEKGLCRISVQDGRFAVLFPDMAEKQK